MAVNAVLLHWHPPLLFSVVTSHDLAIFLYPPPLSPRTTEFWVYLFAHPSFHNKLCPLHNFWSPCWFWKNLPQTGIQWDCSKCSEKSFRLWTVLLHSVNPYIIRNRVEFNEFYPHTNCILISCFNITIIDKLQWERQMCVFTITLLVVLVSIISCCEQKMFCQLLFIC